MAAKELSAAARLGLAHMACGLVMLLSWPIQSAHAQAPRPEWTLPPSATKPAPPKSVAKPPVQPPAKPTFLRTTPPPQPSRTVTPPPTTPVGSIDQSLEVLDRDFALATAIASLGPWDGYATALSPEGILYDASGASPAGADAAAARFSSFPPDVKLERTPEKALAAGGSGSSWGGYAIVRGDTVLSSGRYVSVWRREASGWMMISELAAGKTLVSPSGQLNAAALPKRPETLGRAPPVPVGKPLTIPTLPSAPSSSEPSAKAPQGR